MNPARKQTSLKRWTSIGLHRHFTGDSSILMLGGGTREGYVQGATADERPCLAADKPVGIEDLHATIFTAMGISPKTQYEIEQRPFYDTRDRKGVSVDEVFLKASDKVPMSCNL